MTAKPLWLLCWLFGLSGKSLGTMSFVTLALLVQLVKETRRWCLFKDMSINDNANSDTIACVAVLQLLMVLVRQSVMLLIADL